MKVSPSSSLYIVLCSRQFADVDGLLNYIFLPRFHSMSGALASSQNNRYKLSPMSGKYWEHKFYKNMSEGVASHQECAVACDTDDDGPCFIFIFQMPYCYLGDWNVNTDVTSDISYNSQAYTREGK